MSHEAGKGDLYRPVDRDKYDKNYLRVYGDKCPKCLGSGRIAGVGFRDCEYCDGVGYIERRHSGCNKNTVIERKRNIQEESNGQGPSSAV